MYPIIRLEHVELTNFKNVRHGIIEHSEYRNKLLYTKKADVLGIYGQNGSGKTAIVETIEIVKDLMSANQVKQEFEDLIYIDEKSATLKYIFYIEDKIGDRDIQKYLVYYEVTFARKKESKDEESRFFIQMESLSYSKIGVRAKIELIRIDYTQDDSIFFPKTRVTELCKKSEDTMEALQQIKETTRKERRSFIFDPNIIERFNQQHEIKEYGHILYTLHYYARMNLFVVSNRSVAETGIWYIPLSFRLTIQDIVSSGVAPIRLIGKSEISANSYELIRLVINQLNIVLKSILPDLYLEIWEHSKADDMKTIELYSVRNQKKIPLKCESEGIKKMISILSTLISVYNNPSICLVVDELDAGIFEYLLGELLEIINKYGLGQLIFTSHNLRALEKLPKECIIISTTNENNRFIRIPHEKNMKNYRHSYLRQLDLGGVGDEVYSSANQYEISFAFRVAGEMFEEE